MKLRLTGKKEDVEVVVDILIGAIRRDTEIEVLEVSDFYPNRGNSVLGRIYMELEVR